MSTAPRPKHRCATKNQQPVPCFVTHPTPSQPSQPPHRSPKHLTHHTSRLPHWDHGKLPTRPPDELLQYPRIQMPLRNHNNTPTQLPKHFTQPHTLRQQPGTDQMSSTDPDSHILESTPTEPSHKTKTMTHTSCNCKASMTHTTS